LARQKVENTDQDLALHFHFESNPSMQCQNLAFDQCRESTSGNSMPQMAENDPKYIVERYGVQQNWSM